MRRRICAICAAVLLCAVLPGTAAPAEAPELRIEAEGGEVLPGRAVILRMTVPEDGTCDIRILDAEGQTIAAVAENRAVTAGENAMYWNGTCGGIPVPEGEWRLVMEMNGRTAETPVTVGRMVPCLISPALSGYAVPAGRRITAAWCATESGEVTVTLVSEEAEMLCVCVPVKAGDGTAEFEACVPPGDYRVELTLRREDGTASEPAVLELTVRDPAEQYSPLWGSSAARQDWRLDGWTVPMDILDEGAVWQALMAPVTVVDDGKSTDQRRQVVIRKAPDPDSDGVGMVTMISQGVHVLERGPEWSLIECYSSSFHDSEVLNWNVLVQGYVPTAYLREVTPNPEMGLVVDKLTQRMYIFRDGSLYSTLAVSTGLPNAKQPYNETRSGEFLLVSKVGGFKSDNMYCPMAIRFNAGDMIHAVPYIRRNRDYSITEPLLGTKASHGCVRVQRRRNPEGVSMTWIWKNYKPNTKILIWEDWQGRQIPVPEDDTVFYLNLRENNYYHSSRECSELGGGATGKITYGALSGEEGAKLRPCPCCLPAKKCAEIEEINARYAEGGDHQPELTEALKDCPKTLKQR